MGLLGVEDNGLHGESIGILLSCFWISKIRNKRCEPGFSGLVDFQDKKRTPHTHCWSGFQPRLPVV